MHFVLAFALLISSALTPRAAVSSVRLVLSSDQAQVTTADYWTYTLTVESDTPQSLVVEDVIDLRLRIEAMSPDCAEPAPNLVRCAITAPAVVTATVQVRHNACEPNLCRDIDWWISRQVRAPRLGLISNAVLVHVSRPDRLGRPRPDVALPLILR